MAADSTPSRSASDHGRAFTWREALAAAGFVLAAVGGVGSVLAGPGYRFGWWKLGRAFELIQWTTLLAIAAAVIALVGAAVARRRGMRGLALAGLLIALVSAAPSLAMRYNAEHVPPIHDITTDTEHPPVFVDVLPLRKQARNPVDVNPTTLAQQRRGYPDLHPALLSVPPAQALQRAERVARAMGWEIVAVSPADGRLEATATTLMFGFKDDVVVRVTPQGPGSRVDVRSLSRIGVSDIGTNAKRVRAFVDKLESAAD